jgi:hypothetical protein
VATTAAHAGAVTYDSIDKFSAAISGATSLSLASINGVFPSNLAATSGQYDWWYEATAQLGNITSPNGGALYNWLISDELERVSTAPHAKSVLAIPFGFPNLARVPVTNTSSMLDGVTIYINPFSRFGNSCSIPAETN